MATYEINLSEIAKKYHQVIAVWMGAEKPSVIVVPGKGTYGSQETAEVFKAWCIAANGGTPVAGDHVKILGSNGIGHVHRIDSERAWVWDLENYWEEGLEMIAHWFDVSQLSPIPSSNHHS